MILVRKSLNSPPGYKGSHCERADLLHTQLDFGFSSQEYPSWGGAPIFYNGKYQLFASYMVNQCGIKSYGTNSAVLKAVSDLPQGPYTFVETVLPPFHHGPAVAVGKDGKLLVFADGKDMPKETIHDCTKVPDKDKLPKKNGAKEKVGVYVCVVRLWWLYKLVLSFVW